MNWQACAVWQWYNYAASRVPAGKEPLRINLDETSVCLFQGDAKGTVFFRKKRKRGRRLLGGAAGAPSQQVSRKKRRTCVTHIGVVCDNAAVQPRLPQVLIGNCQTFLVREWAALNARVPANVFLIRQKSAWNNVAVCRRVVGMLGAALQPFAARYQPILLMDAARAHLHASVAERCAAKGIWLIVVPAKLTWLLQPCDTHAFQRYKLYLKAAYQRLQISSASGQVSTPDFITAVCQTIRFVLQARRWAGAFDQDGYEFGQARLAPSVLRQIGLDVSPSVGAARPSEDVVRLCYPRNAAIPLPTLLRPMEPAARPALAGAAIAAAAPGPAAPIVRAARLVPLRPAAALVARPGPQTRSQSRLASSLAAGPAASRQSPLRRPGKADRQLEQGD